MRDSVMLLESRLPRRLNERICPCRECDLLRAMEAHELSDEAVTLRPWNVDDADWYAGTVVDDELIQRFTAEPPTVTPEDVRSAIHALLCGSPGAAGFLIADTASQERLGNIAVTYMNGAGDVSYWLADYARGRGVATRALRLFTDWSFTTLGLSELRLWAHADNNKSRAVAERAGYVRDPRSDQRRQVKGQMWPTVGYVHRGPMSPSS
jgi:ribosomal-protein-alanine N-acetyltransferase